MIDKIISYFKSLVKKEKVPTLSEYKLACTPMSPEEYQKRQITFICDEQRKEVSEWFCSEECYLKETCNKERCKHTMLDKDKVLLIYYYGFDKITPLHKVSEVIRSCSKYTNTFFDGTIKVIVVPQFYGRKSRIEYINKDKLTQEEIINLESNINKYELLLNKNIDNNA